MKKIFVSLFVLTFVAGLFAQVSLSGKVLGKIKESVFEIVVDKCEDEKIEYERDLPMERIPYQIRNDKYIPIGTAFVMEDGSFYTAAHVIDLYGKTYYPKYYVRDKNGNVYQIKDIESFSTNRDFIKFTVPSYSMSKNIGLKLSPSYEMNSTVYSVGNALGEGIIVRNGMLTSETFEDHNGEWKWLRFSAAASPGNSGGPLVKKDGSVIGIITMKSPNENLNYALPIMEAINFAKNTGEVKQEYYYRIPNVTCDKFYFEFKKTLKLPQSYEQIHKVLTQDQIDLHKDLVKKIREQYGPNAPKSFAKNNNRAEFLYNTYKNSFPYISCANETGNWDVFQPKDINTYQLKDNGFIAYGSMIGYSLNSIRKPDSVNLKDLIENPKIYNDYIVEGANLYRNIGNERINIKSLGNPCKSETYKDYFGRNWYVNYYDIKFAGSMMITFALPTPQGLFVIVSIDDVAEVESAIYLDMQFVADHVFVFYHGSYREWKEYLDLPKEVMEMRSEQEKQFTLKENSSEVEFSTGSVKIKLSKDKIPIDDELTLYSTSGYFSDGNNLKMVNRYAGFYTNPNEQKYVSYFSAKITKPQKGALKNTEDEFTQMKNKVYPFNCEPYNNDKMTVITDVQNINDDELLYYSLAINNQNAFEEVTSLLKFMQENTELK